ncbi:protein of unknown function [Cupriavidus taiwanensis]|nr:protein of unknown function [Cupriavidus taiwanensis]
MSLSAPFGTVGAYEGLRRTSAALVYYIPYRAQCKDNARAGIRERGVRKFWMTGEDGPQNACQGGRPEQPERAAEPAARHSVRVSNGRGAGRGRPARGRSGRYRAAAAAPEGWHGAPHHGRQSGRATAGRRVAKGSVVRRIAWRIS